LTHKIFYHIRIGKSRGGKPREAKSKQKLADSLPARLLVEGRVHKYKGRYSWQRRVVETDENARDL
jgi:hypothetical protein